jgi:hypothetical protein
MGFVGFKSESDAATARDYFNHTYIDACRISIEVRMAVGGNRDGQLAAGLCCLGRSSCLMGMAFP